MILIFSEKYDHSSSEVIKWLNHYNQKVIRINGDDNQIKFHKIDSSGVFFRNAHNNEIYNLLEAKSCWWRRSGINQVNFLNAPARNSLHKEGFDLSSFVTGPGNLLAYETKDLKHYIFSKVYASAKINIGSPSLYGLNKMFVLDLARKHGLTVPDYEIVSDTTQIRENETLGEKVVTKAISDGIYRTIDHHHFYTYTELLEKSSVPEGSIKIFPSLIMELIEKKFEIRAFFLDGDFYSMAIFSQTNSKTNVDFRKYDQSKPNKCEPFQLPSEVQQKLRGVFSDLKLNSGSVDLIVNEEDDYVFLEINPVGQYGMVSDPCNYNLHHLVAKYLIHGKQNN